VLEGIFFFPVACYLGRYFYTLVVALVLRLHFPFLLALLTLAQTLLPGISAYPWLSCIPWVCHLICHGMMQPVQLEFMVHPFETRMASFSLAALLFISQYVVLDMFEDTVAQRSFHIIPSWVTGLSIVCGFEHFGLHAVYFGPLVVSLAVLFFELFTEDDQPHGEDEGGQVHQEDITQVDDAPVPSADVSANNGGVGLTAADGSCSVELENFVNDGNKKTTNTEVPQPGRKSITTTLLRRLGHVALSDDVQISRENSETEPRLRRQSSAEEIYSTAVPLAGYSAEDEREDMKMGGKHVPRRQPSRKTVAKTRRLGEKLHHAFLGT